MILLFWGPKIKVSTGPRLLRQESSPIALPVLFLPGSWLLLHLQHIILLQQLHLTLDLLPPFLFMFISYLFASFNNMRDL